MNYRLTPLAAEDIGDILRTSARRFGTLQRTRYAALIERAADMIAESPLRPGSRQRNDLTPGLRSFHIELAAGRRGAASHVLYYLPDDASSTEQKIVIVRVLYDGMEPGLHFLDDTAYLE